MVGVRRAGAPFPAVSLQWTSFPIPHCLAVYVIPHTATKHEWVWNFPLHSPIVIFFIHFAFTEAQLPWTPAASLFFFFPPLPPFFFFLWETKTQWKIIFPSYKPTHEEVKNRWEQFLFPVLFCKTASHLKTCYQGIFVEPSVSPHHTQLIFNKKYIVLMFWGYPKIFTFRKRANQGQVRWTPVS